MPSTPVDKSGEANDFCRNAQLERTVDTTHSDWFCA
jgi:hypothetical protein